MVIDVEQADHLLTTTRSVRRRLDLAREVDDHIVYSCLRIAQQAPSASNLQPARWLVVKNPSLKSSIGKIYARASGELTRLIRARDGGNGNLDVLGSADILDNHLGDVPLLVIACVERADWERSSRFPLLAAANAYGSVFPAVWSFQLALRARGLGTCFVAAHLKYADELAELLNLPPTFDQVGIVAVAHTVGARFSPAPRRPLGEIVRENVWS